MSSNTQPITVDQSLTDYIRTQGLMVNTSQPYIGPIGKTHTISVARPAAGLIAGPVAASRSVILAAITAVGFLTGFLMYLCRNQVRGYNRHLF